MFKNEQLKINHQIKIQEAQQICQNCSLTVFLDSESFKEKLSLANSKIVL